MTWVWALALLLVGVGAGVFGTALYLAYVITKRW